jgi:hypothetical protein
VIDAEFGREDHSSILRNCDRGETETHDAQTDIQTRLNWW